MPEYKVKRRLPSYYPQLADFPWPDRITVAAKGAATADYYDGPDSITYATLPALLQAGGIEHKDLYIRLTVGDVGYELVPVPDGGYTVSQSRGPQLGSLVPDGKGGWRCALCSREYADTLARVLGAATDSKLL